MKLTTLIRTTKTEVGQALPIALLLLLLGGLLVIPSLSFMTTSLNYNRTIEEYDARLYAADAGLQYACWKFFYDPDFNPTTDTLEFPQGRLGSPNECYVTLSKEPVGDYTYKVTSVAYDPKTEKSTTIIAYLNADETAFEPVPSPFDYAVGTLSGNLVMTGSARITSDCSPQPCYEGDVWVTGDISLGWSNYIEGSAVLTGNCNRPQNVLEGVQSGDPLPRPVWLDDKLADFIASTFVAEPTCAGAFIPGNWNPPPGNYGAVQVGGNLTIGGNGQYTFTSPVCVGGNLTIQSGTNHVLFQSTVKVDGNANFQGNGTVTFQDVLYLGGYLYAGGSRSILFQGKVAVNGGQKYSQQYVVYFDGSKFSGVAYDVVFSNTLRATEPDPNTCYKVRFGSGRKYEFYDVVYTTESLYLEGNPGSSMAFTKAVIAECDIRVSGSSNIDAPPESSPYFASLHGNVILEGDVRVDAIVYAPEGSASVSGSSQLEGAIVAGSVYLSGNVRLKYPVVVREREDTHPGDGGGNGKNIYSLVVYSIK